MQRKEPFFYGWVIVAAGAAMLALALGVFNSTNSIFVKPICEAFGFARGQFTFHRTIITLVGALTMPLYGKWIQKIGVKKVMLIGALALSASAAGYSFATKLWHFYAVAAIHGLFVNGVGFMSVGALVNIWFHGKKGIASGLAFAGSGLGGAVMVPVIGRVIEATSWQAAYRLMGLIGLVALVPVVALLVRNTPEEVGLMPLAEDRERSGENSETASEMTFGQAARTGSFWVLLIAFFFISFFAAATNTHSAPYLSDLGYSTAFVSAVISLLMLFLTVGKIVLGLVYDRFGALAGNAVVAAFGLAFPVFALLSYIPAMPWLYAVCTGMASCGVSVSLSLQISRFFGRKDFPTIFSFFSMITSLASSISVPAIGAIFDSAGSYRLAWFIFLGTSTIIAMCLVGVELRFRKKRSRSGIGHNKSGALRA